MSRDKNWGLLRAATPTLPRLAGEDFCQGGSAMQCKSIPEWQWAARSHCLYRQKESQTGWQFGQIVQKTSSNSGLHREVLPNPFGGKCGREVLQLCSDTSPTWATGALLGSWSLVLMLDRSERCLCNLLFLGYFQVWEKNVLLTWVTLCKKANPSNIIGSGLFISIS